MKDLTYDEIELVRESLCEACKGVWFIHETGCYEDCRGFAEELKTIREEEGNGRISGGSK